MLQRVCRACYRHHPVCCRSVLDANQVQREVRLKFESACGAREAVDSRIRAYADVLLGVRVCFIASDSVSRGEFRDYIHSLALSHRYPGIQGINYGQRISAAQVRTFVAMVRKDTSVDPTVIRVLRSNRGRPAGVVVVTYVEPTQGTK